MPNLRIIPAADRGFLKWTVLMMPPSALAGILLTVLLNTGAGSLPILLVISLCILLVLPVIRGRRDLFQPVMFVVLANLGYAVGALYAVLGGDLAILGVAVARPEASYYLSLALAYAFLGVLSFYAGYYALGGRTGRRTASFGDLRLEWQAHRFRIVIIAYTLLGLLSYSLFMRSVGGVAYYVTHLYARTFLGENLVFQIGSYLLPAATILWSCHYFLVDRNRLFWLHLALSSLVLLTFGGRFGLFSMWLIILVTYYYLSDRKLRLGLFVLAGSLTLIIGVTVVGYRAAAAAGHTDLESLWRYRSDFFSVPQLLETTVGGRIRPDINILAQLLLEVPERLDFQRGRTIGFALPQLIWPDRPAASVGRLITQALYPGIRAGIPPSFVGELYLNFNLPGIIAGMLGLGIASRWLYRFVLLRGTANDVLLYAIVMVSFVYLLLIADIGTATKNLLVYIVPTILAIGYMAKRPESQRLRQDRPLARRIARNDVATG